MDMDMDDGFGTFIAIAVSMFSVFVLIVCCVGICGYMNKRKRQTLYSTPVVVTAQPFQPANGREQYPVNLQTRPSNPNEVQQPPTHQNIQMPMPMPMPMPQHNFQTPYPPAQSNQAYPPAAPGNHSAPYPISNPYNPSNSQMEPPSYNQAVKSDQLQQQPPFNPSYKG